MTVVEFDFSEDAPCIHPETESELWALRDAFEGEVKLTEENKYDDDFLLASAFGWYLGQIGKHWRNTSPKTFIPEYAARASRERCPRCESEIIALSLPQPIPTPFNRLGVYPGVLDALRARAGRVFQALLTLEEVDDWSELEATIANFSDELLMDCTIWSFLMRNNTRTRGTHSRAIVRAIEVRANLPLI